MTLDRQAFRNRNATQDKVLNYTLRLIKPTAPAEEQKHKHTDQDHEAKRDWVGKGILQLRHERKVHTPDPRKERGRIEDCSENGEHVEPAVRLILRMHFESRTQGTDTSIQPVQGTGRRLQIGRRTV